MHTHAHAHARTRTHMRAQFHETCNLAHRPNLNRTQIGRGTLQGARCGSTASLGLARPFSFCADGGRAVTTAAGSVLCSQLSLCFSRKPGLITPSACQEQGLSWFRGSERDACTENPSVGDIQCIAHSSVLRSNTPDTMVELPRAGARHATAFPCATHQSTKVYRGVFCRLIVSVANTEIHPE